MGCSLLVRVLLGLGLPQVFWGLGPATAREEEPLTAVLLGEASSLHPLARQVAANWYLSGFLNRHLLTIAADGSLRADLLADLPLVNRRHLPRSSGGLAMLPLHLRELARWGDGKAVTARDVIFSWQIGLTQALSADEAALYGNISDIRADPFDSKKCYLFLKKLSWHTLYELSHFVVLPRHWEDERFRLYGRSKSGYRDFSLYEINPLQAGLYNGPFIVSSLQRGKQLVLERNNYFYGPPALSARLVVRLGVGSEELAHMLKSESIHLVFPLGLGQRERTYLQKTIARNHLPLVVTSVPSFTYELLSFNMNSKILSDWKVRKALLVGLNRDRLLQSSFAQDVYRAESFISPVDPLLGSKLHSYPAPSEFDLHLAEKLLDDAGWRRGKDGLRWRRGEKLRLSLLSNKEQVYRKRLARLLVEEWRRHLGIEVVFSQQEAQEFFGRTLKKPHYGDMALLAWRYQLGEVPSQRFHSSGVPAASNNFVGFNFSQWRSNRVDQLLDALEEDGDELHRQQLMQRLVQAYFHDIPEVPLFFRSRAALRSKELTGFQLWSHGIPESYGSEFWQLSP